MIRDGKDLENDGPPTAALQAHGMVSRARTLTDVYARLAETLETLDAQPRFHFHFNCGGRVSVDQCGVELPDLAAARRWAEAEARNLMQPEMPLGVDPLAGTILIADDDGQVLAEIRVRDVIGGR
jgi:hypothetical protein